MDDTSISPPRRDTLPVSEEAAQWFEALKTAGRPEREAFARWLKESPMNVREFLRTTALDVELGRIDASRFPDIQALIDAACSNIVRLDVAPSANHPRDPVRAAEGRARAPWRRVAGFAAIAGGFALLSAWLLLGDPSVQEYGTTIGEQRTFDLEDGSVISLNTDSHVEVRITPSSRDVRMSVGSEAMFKVARDPRRPFRVHTDNMVVQAVGTQFNVRRNGRNEGGGSQVAVIEGRVQVSGTSPGSALPETGESSRNDAQRAREIEPTRLDAGEAASVVSDGPVVKSASADLSKITAWRQRRLMFKRDTFLHIASEFNRYNRTLRIELEGDVAERRFSGVFDADDPESLADVLSRDATLSVERTEKKIVIRAR
jgi:transmembrane sensor